MAPVTPSVSPPDTLAVTVCTRRVPTCMMSERPVVRATSATCSSSTRRPVIGHDRQEAEILGPRAALGDAA